MKSQYIQLDESYDDYAKDIATLRKKHDKIKNKVDELDKQFSVIANRIELYIKNVVWKDYSYKKYTFLISCNEKPHHLKFFLKENVTIAREQYEEKCEDEDTTFDEELETVDDEFLFETVFGVADLDEMEADYNDMITFLIEHSGTPSFDHTLTSSQEATINELAQQLDSVEKKFQYAKEKQNELSEAYDSCMMTIIETLEDDDDYDFNREVHEIVTSKDSNTMRWHLYYCLPD